MGGEVGVRYRMSHSNRPHESRSWHRWEESCRSDTSAEGWQRNVYQENGQIK